MTGVVPGACTASYYSVAMLLWCCTSSLHKWVAHTLIVIVACAQLRTHAVAVHRWVPIHPVTADCTREAGNVWVLQAVVGPMDSWIADDTDTYSLTETSARYPVTHMNHSICMESQSSLRQWPERNPDEQRRKKWCRTTIHPFLLGLVTMVSHNQ